MATKLIEARMVRLFDVLAAAPDGLDIYQIADKLYMSVSPDLYKVIRELRLQLGALSADEDERIRGYTIPIRREGTRQVYFLSARREDGHEWQAVHVDTLTSRIEVDVAYWRSLTAIADGRSREGKIARACVKHFERLLEDITEIRDSV